MPADAVQFTSFSYQLQGIRYARLYITAQLKCFPESFYLPVCSTLSYVTVVLFLCFFNTPGYKNPRG